MPAANHLVLLVEEPSMEAFLHALLPRLMPARRTFEIHPFQGKDDLMAKLCVFRNNVTARFGNVTGHFGDRDRSRISDHRDR